MRSNCSVRKTFALIFQVEKVEIKMIDAEKEVERIKRQRVKEEAKVQERL